MSASRFYFERELFAGGITEIAGIDEAGRGPLAGPVVAAAVQFPAEWIRDRLPRSLYGLNDSKQLTREEREDYFMFLTSQTGIRFAVASVDVPTIDAINILQATHRAMNAALAQLQPPPVHVLVDGLPVQSLALPHTAIVSGDAKSYSIAAASVLAKVTRDRMMVEFDRTYPQYGFAQHKGYGTPDHLTCLAEYGPCAIHRRSFAPVRHPELPLFV